MTQNLPLLGAQVVLLGGAAFERDIRAIGTQVTQLSRVITNAFSQISKSSAQVGDDITKRLTFQSAQAASQVLQSKGFTGPATSASSILAARMEAAEKAAIAEANALTEAGTAAASFGTIAVGAFGVAAAATLTAAGAAEKLGTEYITQLNYVGALSLATADQLKQLDEAQLSLTGRTNLSAKALADMSTELVKAGFSTEQLNKGTLEAVANLQIASKGELSNADSATLAAVAVNAFGVSAKEAADVATAAVQNSALSFSGFADAIKQGGPAAKQAGLSIQEFSAVVALMGQEIKSGQVVGTDLRQMFLKLQDPSKQAQEVLKQYQISLYQANGSARPFRDVLVDLQAQFSNTAVENGKLTQAERDYAVATIFGTRAATGVEAALNQGVAAYDKQIEAGKRLKSQDIANTVLAQTSEQAKILTNRVNALTIAFVEGLDPAINDAIKTINGLIPGGEAAINVFKTLGEIIGKGLPHAFDALVPALGPLSVLKDFSKLLPEIPKSLQAFQDTRTQQKALQDFQANIANEDKLLKDGKITQDQYNQSVADFTDIYNKATAAVRSRQALAQGKQEAAPTVSTLKTTPGFQESADDIQKYHDAVDKLNELTRDFNDDVQKSTVDATKQISKLYEQAYNDVADAVARHDKDVQKANEEATKNIAQAQTDQAVKDDTDARKRALEQRLQDEAEARKQGLEDADAAHKQELEDYENQLKQERDAREQAFREQQDDAAAVRNRELDNNEKQLQKLEDQQQEHNKRIQDDEDKALKDRQERRQRDFDQQQEQEKQNLDAQHKLLEDKLKSDQDAQDRALKADQDRRERALKEQQDAEKRAFDVKQKLEQAITDDTRARAQAEYEYQQDIDKGVKQSIAQARLQEKLGKIAQDTATKRLDLADQTKQNQEQADFEAQQQKDSLALQQQFDQEKLNLEKSQQAETVKLRAKTEQETLDLKKRQEEDSFKLKQEFENDKDALQRKHDDDRAAYSEQVDAARLKRSQAREDADRAQRRLDEQALRNFNLQEDANALAQRRIQDENERQRKRGLDIAEIQFKRDQENEQLKLDHELAQEELKRRIQSINNERDERIRAANEVLAEERVNILKHLAQQVVDLRENLAEKLNEIRKNYVDKLDDLMRDAGNRLQPLTDIVLGNMDRALDSIRQSAADATTQLAETFQAEAQVLQLEEERRKRNAANPPPSVPPVEAISPGMNNQPRTVLQPGVDFIPSRQYGGIVPGPYGSPVMVRAHAGERFEGLGGYSASLTAVRVAESMRQRGLSGSTYITNNEYAVNANYGKVQEEGSIRQDLSALIMLTRR